MANAMAGSSDLSDAFSVDPNTLDLSGMLDLSAINISLPEAPDLSLGNLMSGIKIQASGDDVSNLAAALLKGYQEYAKEHPEADYSGLGENFIGYLNTEKAQEILKNNIKDIIEASGFCRSIKRRTAAADQRYHDRIPEVCPGKGLYGYDEAG